MEIWKTILACVAVCEAGDQFLPLPSVTNEVMCSFEPQNQNSSLTASIEYTKLSTEDDCFRTCYEDSECTYVEYNADKGKCLVYIAGEGSIGFASTVYHLKRNTPSTQCEKHVTFGVSSSPVSPTTTYRIKIHSPNENPLRLYIGDFLQGTLLRVILTPLGSDFDVNMHPGDSQAMEGGTKLMHFKVRWGWKVICNSYRDGRYAEEDYINGPFGPTPNGPFERDQISTVDFIANIDNGNRTVLIYVDGRFYHDFYQREQLITSWAQISGAKIHAVYVK